MTCEQNRGWSSVPRQIYATSVDHVGKVPLAKVNLNKLFSEGSLHESIGNDHTHPTSRTFLWRVTSNRQVKESLGKRNAELIFTVAGRESAAVSLSQDGIIHIDIRWITNNNVILLAENTLQILCIFSIVKMLNAISEKIPCDASAPHSRPM